MKNVKLSDKDAKSLTAMFNTLSYDCFIQDLQAHSTDGCPWVDEILDVLNKVQEQLQKTE